MWGNEDFIKPERLSSQFTTYPSTPATMRLLLLCLILSVEKDGEKLKEGTQAGDGTRHLHLLPLRQPSSSFQHTACFRSGTGLLISWVPPCHPSMLHTFPLLFF